MIITPANVHLHNTTETGSICDVLGHLWAMCLITVERLNRVLPLLFPTPIVPREIEKHPSSESQRVLEVCLARM